MIIDRNGFYVIVLKMPSNFSEAICTMFLQWCRLLYCRS